MTAPIAPIAPAAVLVKAKGSVYAERNGTRTALNEGDNIEAADIIITDANSVAEVHFADGATASLSPGTTLEVKNFVFGGGQEPSFILNLVQGTMRSVSGEVVKQNPEAFSIITPNATMGIRGTEVFNAVHGNTEVHAVLHIGKGHIVVITGADGQSVTLNAAMQVVNLAPGTQGPLVMQTYTPQEMQNVIQRLAPTQLQKPLPKADNSAERQEGEAAPGAEASPKSAGEQSAQKQQADQQADQQQAAQGEGQSQSAGSSSSVSTVVLIVEADTSAALEGQGQAGLMDSANTLISVVENLQNSLADAGFKVEVVTPPESGESLFPPYEPPTSPETVLPPAPPADTTPPLPPDTTPPLPPQDGTVLDASEVQAWGVDHLVGNDASQGIKLTINGSINNVGDLMMNANTATGGSTGSDTVIINGDYSNGAFMGDAFALADGSTITFGNDHLTVTGNVTNVDIFGDAANITPSGGAGVVLGNDTITINGDFKGTINGDNMLGGDLAGASGGHDVITVTGTVTGSKIYGGMGDDAISLGQVSTSQIFGDAGTDTLTIGSLTNSTVQGGAGDDVINVSGATTGSSIDGGAGKDQINLGQLDSSTVRGGAGEDVINITGTITGSKINGGGDNDTITVGSLISSTVEGGTGNDVIAVTGANTSTIDGGQGDDKITVTNMSNSSVVGGAGADAITVNGTLSGACTIDLGAADGAADSLTMKNVTISEGTTVNIVGFEGSDTLNFDFGATVTGTASVDGNNTVITWSDGGKTWTVVLENKLMTEADWQNVSGSSINRPGTNENAGDGTGFNQQSGDVEGALASGGNAFTASGQDTAVNVYNDLTHNGAHTVTIA